MIDRPRLLTLEEVQQAPDTAMIYLEYEQPMQYHGNGLRQAAAIRALICPEYLAAHYGQRFRCWSAKPSPRETKANEWRGGNGSEKEGAL